MHPRYNIRMDMMICLQCQYYGRPAKKKRGSDGTAFAAWAVFPIGLPYTLWRMLTKVPVCKECGSDTLVDVASASGARLMARMVGEVAPPVANDVPAPDHEHAAASRSVASLPNEDSPPQAPQTKRKPRVDEW